MIVGLLILIVLILLFGAGVVKGWLANLAGMVMGVVLLIAAGIWVNTYFGEYGIIAVCIFLLVLFFCLKVWLDSGPA